ncbi:hypothetical protein [Nitrosomonas sp. Nm34]|uniref:hypothetical protein n=1 Tax=Nitrosomonas sp. Nm34 TaxID=1881055 RepID=UPI0011133DB8|nr:hypothetical protein [Nitrosomonas sp. Nm34]
MSKINFKNDSNDDAGFRAFSLPVISLLNQNWLCRLHLAVLWMLSVARLRIIFNLEMELDRLDSSQVSAMSGGINSFKFCLLSIAIRLA